MPPKVEAGDGRQRQGRRDDLIRKKLQAEMSKRSRQVGKRQTPRKRPQGSVMALKPLAPVVMETTVSVLEAAQYMSAHRANGVLVMDADGAVCGIFTAKDIAFKVVGDGKDFHQTKVSDIMTPNPTVTTIDTNATDALDLMVKRGFRHLPVVDNEGSIAGVLDITKCFYEAMEKLERAYESSKKLQDALEGVKTELGGGSQPVQFLSYVEALRERTAGPDLSSVLDGRQPLYVDKRTNVAEIAQLMREHRTTAVLITDNSAVIGIFTTKDIVLRVVAAGLNPQSVSVIRVMTSNPDSAPITMGVQDALRKMHDGHYLNLPVMDTDDTIVGIVDVLKLTYATLEQIHSMSAETSEGPAWNKFWNSLDETDSQHSDSRPTTAASTTHPLDPPENAGGDSVSASASELAQFSLPDGPELAPEDSLSRSGMRAEYNNAGETTQSVVTAVPETFAFKFRSPSGRAHRVLVSVEEGLEVFRRAIISRLSTAELQELGGPGKLVDGLLADGSGFAVSYVDDDGDPVSITVADDIVDAVRGAQRKGANKADVYLHASDVVPEIKTEVPLDPMIPAMIAGGVALVAIAIFAFRGKK